MTLPIPSKKQFEEILLEGRGALVSADITSEEFKMASKMFGWSDADLAEFRRMIDEKK